MVHADLLLFVVVLAENVFGLVDANAINIAGVLNIDLVWQGLLLVLSVYLYAKSLRVQGTKTSATQGVLLGCLIILCFVASWRCNVLTGQPFMRGLIPQRGFMVCLAAAILLRRPFKAGMVDGRRLMLGIVLLGSIASGLYLLQAVVGSSVTFIHALSGERYGGLRLYIKGALSTASGILGLWLCLRDNDWKYLTPAVLALGVTLFVSKGRLELITYLATLLILFISAKGTASSKILIVCIAGLALILFSQMPFFDKVVGSFINGQVGGTENTSEIRRAGREYYDLVLASTESELLGCGYPSTLYPAATNMAGFQYNYALVDNGIYGYRYVYGNLGVIVVILCLISILRSSLRNRAGHLSSMLFAYHFFLVLPFVNLAWWWNISDWQSLTAIFVAMAWLPPGPWCPRLRRRSR